jgi:hypothetical protein
MTGRATSRSVARAWPVASRPPTSSCGSSRAGRTVSLTGSVTSPGCAAGHPAYVVNVSAVLSRALTFSGIR